MARPTKRSQACAAVSAFLGHWLLTVWLHLLRGLVVLSVLVRRTAL